MFYLLTYLLTYMTLWYGDGVWYRDGAGNTVEENSSVFSL